MKTRRLARRVLTTLLAITTVLAWSLAALVTFRGHTDEAFQPGTHRNLPPITAAKTTTTVDTPALPATFTLPDGFTPDPRTQNAIRLIPESWLPTKAAITIENADRADNTDWETLDHLSPTPVLDHRETATYRAVIAQGDPNTPKASRIWHIYSPTAAITIRETPPDPTNNTFDTAVFPRAMDTILATLQFR